MKTIKSGTGRAISFNGFKLWTAVKVCCLLTLASVAFDRTLLRTQQTSNASHMTTPTTTSTIKPFLLGDNTSTDLNTLPQALQEPSFQGCCNDERSCENTCFTENACIKNTTYPFASLEDKTLYARWEPSGIEHTMLRQRCSEANGRLTPPNRGCQEGHIDLMHIPTGCSRYSNAGGSGAFQHLLIFPAGKLAFCGIPKVGITQWIQFLRFTAGAKDYQSLPHFKRDVNHFRFDKMRPALQLSILNDAEWTRAIFIRNPAERLLSAYLDKIQNRSSKSFPFFGRDNMTFAEFVDVISTTNVTCPTKKGDPTAGIGLTWCTDPHWRPQAWSCGLSEYLPRFQFVGNFDHTAEQSKLLLQHVDMWENFGKHYRVVTHTRGATLCKTFPPPALEFGEAAFGFQQVHGKNGTDGMDTHSHSTGARTKLSIHYTDELLQKVRQLYQMDYALWDALQERDSSAQTKNVSFTGGELAGKVFPRCQADTRNNESQKHRIKRQD